MISSVIFMTLENSSKLNNHFTAAIYICMSSSSSTRSQAHSPIILYQPIRVPLEVQGNQQQRYHLHHASKTQSMRRSNYRRYYFTSR